jgi:hypothetical protein
MTGCAPDGFLQASPEPGAMRSFVMLDNPLIYLINDVMFGDSACRAPNGRLPRFDPKFVQLRPAAL